MPRTKNDARYRGKRSVEDFRVEGDRGLPPVKPPEGVDNQAPEGVENNNEVSEEEKTVEEDEGVEDEGGLPPLESSERVDNEAPVGVENDSEVSEEEDTDEEDETDLGDSTGVMPPLSMYLPTTEYKKTVKIATRCYVAKAVDTIERVLDIFEKQWFYNHPQFSHIFHMPRDCNHKTQGMWMLLARLALIEKNKEVWFVVNGTPIRYSLREHALISGLHCHQYPERYRDRIGDLSFVKKHFQDGRVTQELVEEKFLKMKKPTSDRLKMAVLYFLTAVIKGCGKRGKRATPVDPFLTKVVSDLDDCVTFPWGRFTFFDTLSEIQRMMKLFDGEANPNANLSCFIIPLELLPFEAIPRLMNEFRMEVKDARNDCPRMCKSKFRRSSMKGFTIEEINKGLGKTKKIDSVLVSTVEEANLIGDIEEEDDLIDAVVDGWTTRLLVEKKRIRFDTMYKEDIEARKDKTMVVENTMAAENTMEKGESSKACTSSLEELKAYMESGFKKITDTLEGMDKRMNEVELAIKNGSIVKEVVVVGQNKEKTSKRHSKEDKN